MIEEAAPYFFWWKQPDWKEKGKPLEIVKLQLNSNKQVEVYNWLRKLTIEEIKVLQETINKFANFADGKAFETLRYIAISNNVLKAKLATGEDVNGAGTLLPFSSPLNGIQLYPNSVIGEHRTGNISNFEGTLKHEISHHLVNQNLIKEWSDRFGWKLEGDKHVCSEEERCISDYAKTSPTEDICDSIAALLSDNLQLDQEKASFLTNIFPNSEEDSIVDSQILQNENLQPPQLKTIYYRKSGIRIL